MTVTQPGRAVPGTVSPVSPPAALAASMARTRAEMPPAPAPAQNAANRRASSRRRWPFSIAPSAARYPVEAKISSSSRSAGTLRASRRSSVRRA